MSRVKIRVWGLLEDVQIIAASAAQSPAVVSVSPPYRNRPPSKEYRVYIELETDRMPKLPPR